MRTCSRCGQQSPDQNLSCQECGQPFPAGRGIGFGGFGSPSAALVLGILSVPLICVFGVGFLTGFVAIVLGVFELRRAKRANSSDGRSAIGGIVLGTFCVGIAVVLALPGLFTARVGQNEGAAVTDIRTVMMAEVEYAKANGDLYDTLECVAAPSRCIPGYDATKPAFLPADLASNRDKLGYRRTFHAGPAPQGVRPKGTSPSSITMWAYVAVPVSPGSTGNRSFCGDGTGRVCMKQDGSVPEVSGGMCAESCPDLK